MTKAGIVLDPESYPHFAVKLSSSPVVTRITSSKICFHVPYSWLQAKEEHTNAAESKSSNSTAMAEQKGLIRAAEEDRWRN